MARHVRGILVAAVLLVVSIALGLLAAYQAYEASRVLSAVAVPHGTLDPTNWQHAVVLLPRVLLVVLMLAFLFGVYIWMHYYVLYAQEPGRLWPIFRKSTVIELIVLGAALFVRFGLPWLL